MALPPESAENGSAGDDFSAGLRRRTSPEQRVNAMPVVVFPELAQLPFQIPGIPEQAVIKKLAPGGSDQPFDERVAPENSSGLSGPAPRPRRSGSGFPAGPQAACLS